jgi:hypothetical protein
MLKSLLSEEMLIELPVIAMILEKILNLLKLKMVTTQPILDQPKSELRKMKTHTSVLKKTLKVKVIPTNK